MHDFDRGFVLPILINLTTRTICYSWKYIQVIIKFVSYTMKPFDKNIFISYYEGTTLTTSTFLFIVYI